jgi:hypothetical protein
MWSPTRATFDSARGNGIVTDGGAVAVPATRAEREYNCTVVGAMALYITT